MKTDLRFDLCTFHNENDEIKQTINNSTCKKTNILRFNILTSNKQSSSNYLTRQSYLEFISVKKIIPFSYGFLACDWTQVGEM